jgi:hypothetical protein
VLTMLGRSRIPRPAGHRAFLDAKNLRFEGAR